MMCYRVIKSTLLPIINSFNNVNKHNSMLNSINKFQFQTVNCTEQCHSYKS